MITDKELKLVNLSATNKDFLGIWNELLDVSKKLSERWDPTSTNEADPGIVLLKVLTAIADKLNYNIDKNILEAFMPSAAQRESMQKLCTMLGYNMKYYHSAETLLTISFNSTRKEFQTKISGYDSLYLPIFTNVTTVDLDINYITTEGVYLSEDSRSVKVNCILGLLADVRTDNPNNVVTLTELPNYRFYLPETLIAENGIYVYNYGDGIVPSTAQFWTKVDNLNIADSTNRKIFKLGYSSKEARPYLEFAEDIENQINDGLVIKYVRTSAENGNVSAKTLNTMTLPTNGGWSQFSTDDFTILNLDSAINGRGIETIDSAYNNFKKTIGTFDTLVTCRDYMNKIYMLTDDLDNPLVSNIIVADIRDDINRAVTLCEFENNGIVYVDKSLPEENNTLTSLKALLDTILIPASKVPDLNMDGVLDHIDIEGAKTLIKDSLAKNLIEHFDLVLYPFKTIYNTYTKKNYKKSFTYNAENTGLIKAKLAKIKTVSHAFKNPYSSEIVCIKNYLKLNAKITTTTKVNVAEEASILNNIYTNIFTKFNMRELDFGEEIPFDSIYNCIVDADPKIKTVSLDEPILYTTILLADGTEVPILANVTKALDASTSLANHYINKLILRNVLAGKVSLFNYFTDFKPELSEKTLSSYYLDKYLSMYPAIAEDTSQLVELYPTLTITNVDKISLWDENIKDFNSETTIKSEDNVKGIVLKDNELILFRAPNLKTTTTYPAYVNYYFNIPAADGALDNDANRKIPANAEYLLKEGLTLFINYTSTKTDEETGNSNDYVVNKKYEKGTIIKINLESADYMYDSLVWHDGSAITQTGTLNTTTSSHKWAKTDGFDASLFKINGVPILGMFSVGLNDTIEIREPVEVNLKPKDTDDETKNILIFWELASDKHLGENTDDTDQTDSYVFLDSDPENDVPSSYILGPGEYFYYTDESMLNIAYYGQGSEILLIKDPNGHSGSNIRLEKAANQTLDFEKIMEDGYSAIPWITKTVTKDNYIKIKEYLYVNLTKKDALLGVHFKEDEDISNTSLETGIWKPIETARYLLSGEEADTKLPTLLYTIDVDGVQKDACWQASTFLALNIGPKTALRLNTYSYTSTIGNVPIVITDNVALKINNILMDATLPDNGNGIESLLSTDDVSYIPISIKSNYVIATTNQKISTKVSKYNTKLGEYEDINDFKLRVFEQKDVYYTSLADNGTDRIIADLNTFNEYWSKITLNTDKKAVLHCYVDLPSENKNNTLENYGLLMVYYDADPTKITSANNSAVELVVTTETTTDPNTEAVTELNG